MVPFVSEWLSKDGLVPVAHFSIVARHSPFIMMLIRAEPADHLTGTYSQLSGAVFIIHCVVLEADSSSLTLRV
jgi:hypothetical protein